jgi:hypothetical protein
VSARGDRPRRPAAPPLLLGWREWVALPELGLGWIRAKVDSGARSSSLHVYDASVFDRDGEEWIRFALASSARDPARPLAEAQVMDRRVVTDSGGHRQLRVFIRTQLRLPDGRDWPIEVNLTQRRHMLFPMLLGRTALPRGCLVAPKRSWLAGRPDETNHPE